jgi:hypothetical protein
MQRRVHTQQWSNSLSQDERNTLNSADRSELVETLLGPIENLIDPVWRRTVRCGSDLRRRQVAGSLRSQSENSTFRAYVSEKDGRFLQGRGVAGRLVSRRRWVPDNQELDFFETSFRSSISTSVSGRFRIGEHPEEDSSKMENFDVEFFQNLNFGSWKCLLRLKL